MIIPIKMRNHRRNMSTRKENSENSSLQKAELGTETSQKHMKQTQYLLTIGPATAKRKHCVLIHFELLLHQVLTPTIVLSGSMPLKRPFQWRIYQEHHWFLSNRSQRFWKRVWNVVKSNLRAKSKLLCEKRRNTKIIPVCCLVLKSSGECYKKWSAQSQSKPPRPTGKSFTSKRKTMTWGNFLSYGQDALKTQ